MEFNLWWKTTFDGRRPLMENKFWKETTYERRRLLTEDDHWRKTTFDRRQPLREDKLWRKRSFDRIQPLMVDNLWWKMTFDGRRPLTENLRPSIGCIVYYLKKCLWHLTLTAKAQLTSNRKSYQLSKPEIELHVMEEMYAAWRMCTCAEKTTFLGKDD